MYAIYVFLYIYMHAYKNVFLCLCFLLYLNKHMFSIPKKKNNQTLTQWSIAS